MSINHGGPFDGELDEPDQSCPSCGGDLQPIAGLFEEADEIDVVERSFRVVRHKRQKYRCRCGAGIEIALGPDKLVPGGRYSIDSPWTWPSRSLPITWYLLPTYEANHAHVLSDEVIAVDQTWVG